MSGKTVHIFGECPSAIVVETHRNIGGSVFSSTRERDAVLCGGSKSEELAKPIGVSHFSTLEKGGTRFGGIGLQEAPSRQIVGAHGIIPLTKDAASATIARRIDVKIAFLFHLLIERHGFLRIEQVVLSVIRTQAHTVLRAIVHFERSFALPLLSGHDDNAIQSARSIDRSGRSVFEHLNVLDVGWVESGYR